MRPTLIKSLVDEKIRAVQCGKFHSMFISDSNDLFICGGNSFGQLGIGNKKNAYEPVRIEGISNVKSISAWHFSAAITYDNNLYVWGTGIFGEFLTPRLVRVNIDRRADHGLDEDNED